MVSFKLKCSQTHSETITHPLTMIVSEDEFQNNILNINNHIYTTTLNEPLPETLKVKECIHFWKQWFNKPIRVDDLIAQFNLATVQNEKVKNISTSNLKLLHLVRISISEHQYILIKEPLQQLTIEHKSLMMRLIRKLSQKSSIVCTTNHVEEALLLTNNSYRLSHQGLKRLQSENETSKGFDVQPVRRQVHRVSIKVGEKIILIDPIDIDFIESREGKVEIHIGKEVYTNDKTLTFMESLLIDYGFFRCHRSYLVNLQKVSEIITWSKNSYSLYLNQNRDQIIPLSRDKVKDIEHIFKLSS
ncbi:LytTR family DNA-binding domain-containing protein [Staphylococcus felis]|uniref:LytTR family DNA-binding domain-containing protein n=1 Tax=Staphylococcus felis TaxID=46127 RepID=UPI000E288937|nr:LytTR family transcriptional regulator DNA-binding domain-containing protein [Staphylococcus felis]REI06177.1 ABC transporter ATP-binding protein [Staphylococcus felis]